MNAKFDDEKVLVERFCLVMAGTIGTNLKNGKNVKYGIFPYGYQGEIADRLLRQKFGIVPDYIIDNKWSKYNSRIYSLETLAGIDNDNLVVFVSSDRNDIYDEVRTEIKKSIVKGQVVDLFPMFNEDNDRKVEALRLWAEYADSIKLQGSVAEAGVRDGEFARYINKYFPLKKLYLFDTFEGFHNEQVKNNMIAEDIMFQVNMDYREYHQEARGGICTYPMPNSENIVIKKGFFRIQQET